MEIERKHFTSIASTNSWAKQNAHTFDPTKITLVTADEQTGGRGRFSRRWESPPGLNIYASFCLFMEKHRADIGNLPQVMAIATADILGKMGFHPGLKWPNDVLLSQKKVAGILCETTPLSDFICVVLGIGLNVNMPLDQLQKIDRPATSLLAEDGKSRGVEDILHLLQLYFLKHSERFLEEGFAPFLETYKKLLVHTLGNPLRFHDNRTIVEGTFHGITLDGALSLQLPSGNIKVFHAGEIL
jgi:BirA family biotin operon repressor/biotin-[acetyl-CoA-carboxylase] ligase